MTESETERTCHKLFVQFLRLLVGVPLILAGITVAVSLLIYAALLATVV